MECLAAEGGEKESRTSLPHPAQERQGELRGHAGCTCGRNIDAVRAASGGGAGDEVRAILITRVIAEGIRNKTLLTLCAIDRQTDTHTRRLPSYPPGEFADIVESCKSHFLHNRHAQSR